jgi:hypothetical protein
MSMHIVCAFNLILLVDLFYRVSLYLDVFSNVVALRRILFINFLYWCILFISCIKMSSYFIYKGRVSESMPIEKTIGYRCTILAAASTNGRTL